MLQQKLQIKRILLKLRNKKQTFICHSRRCRFHFVHFMLLLSLKSSAEYIYKCKFCDKSKYSIILEICYTKGRNIKNFKNFEKRFIQTYNSLLVSNRKISKISTSVKISTSTSVKLSMLFMDQPTISVGKKHNSILKHHFQ